MPLKNLTMPNIAPAKSYQPRPPERSLIDQPLIDQATRVAQDLQRNASARRLHRSGNACGEPTSAVPKRAAKRARESV